MTKPIPIQSVSEEMLAEGAFEFRSERAKWIGTALDSEGARDAAQAIYLAMKAVQPLPQGDELRLHVAKALSIPQHHTSWDLLTEVEQYLFLMQADYAIAALGKLPVDDVRLRNLLDALAPIRDTVAGFSDKRGDTSLYFTLDELREIDAAISAIGEC